ncbi:MAG: hypothetical protein IRF12RH_07540 [Rickettsia helvetica]|uniref:Uncharacterized protein n=1 Tax=Rickettsia helvetica TaxID=35789 RepID=A0ABP0T664_RICHE
MILQTSTKRFEKELLLMHNVVKTIVSDIFYSMSFPRKQE